MSGKHAAKDRENRNRKEDNYSSKPKKKRKGLKIFGIVVLVLVVW